MTIKLLQLNINADNYWDLLTHFLLSNDFDVMHLQEVTGKDTIVGNIHSQRDTFIELQKLLSEKYNGEFSIEQRYTSGPDAYMANAIFYKKSFSLVERNEILIAKFDELFPSDSKEFERVGRTLLHLKLAIEGKYISFLNNHFACGGR